MRQHFTHLAEGILRSCWRNHWWNSTVSPARSEDTQSRMGEMLLHITLQMQSKPEAKNFRMDLNCLNKFILFIFLFDSFCNKPKLDTCKPYLRVNINKLSNSVMSSVHIEIITLVYVGSQWHLHISVV